MALLKVLVCRANRRASRDELIEAIWPDHETINATHALDSAASVLRRHILGQSLSFLFHTAACPSHGHQFAGDGGSFHVGDFERPGSLDGRRAQHGQSLLWPGRWRRQRGGMVEQRGAGHSERSFFGRNFRSLIQHHLLFHQPGGEFGGHDLGQPVLELPDAGKQHDSDWPHRFQPRYCR